jgi:hypothetical protein
MDDAGVCLPDFLPIFFEFSCFPVEVSGNYPFIFTVLCLDY